MEEYLKKVHSLVPAEMLAAFLAVNTLLPQGDHNMNLVALAFVGFLTLLYFYVAYKNDLHHNFQQIVLVALTIPIWTMNVASKRAEDLASEVLQVDPNTFIAVANVVLVAIVLLLPMTFDETPKSADD